MRLYFEISAPTPRNLLDGVSISLSRTFLAKEFLPQDGLVTLVPLGLSRRFRMPHGSNLSSDIFTNCHFGK